MLLLLLSTLLFTHHRGARVCIMTDQRLRDKYGAILLDSRVQLAAGLVVLIAMASLAGYVHATTTASDYVHLCHGESPVYICK
jgi:hypothetical protein